MYRTDLINGAMGAQRLTNEKVAEKAGLAVRTVSAVRNGDPSVRLPTLKAIADALGLSMEALFTPQSGLAEAQEEEPAATLS